MTVSHPVAHVPRDVAAEALDGSCARVLIATEDLAEVLGVDRLRHRRGLDNVAEHHRHVTPMGSAVGVGRPAGGRRAGERSPAATAEFHARGIVEPATGAPYRPPPCYN